MTLLKSRSKLSDYGERDWRADLVPRVGTVVIALLGLAGTAIITGFGTGPMHVLGFCLVGGSVLLFGVLASGRLSQHTKSSFIVGTISIASIGSYMAAGFVPGSALGVTLALIFAALLIGRIALIVLFIAFSALAIALTIGIATGLWQGPDPSGFNMEDPRNWIRTTFVSIFVWASAGFSVMFVIGTIEKNLARRRAALASLRKEMAERQVAENARREAEAVANQAQKMEAVGQLAAAIAHDFNNALLVIKGWNEIRGKTDSGDRQREATAAIEQAADHSAQLGKQLLTFSRKDIRMPKFLYLDQFVADTTESLRHLVGPHIEVSIDTQPDVSVYADESQLQQLLFNLVINARDALAGTGTIRIAVSRVSASDVREFEADCERYVLLAVEDDGPGIEKEIRDRVFDPFFTTKGAGKGTGLGLSTVARIVNQSGGHLVLQSEPGQTTFSIFLPAAEVDHSEKAVEAEAEVAENLGLRVLVLEDNFRARDMITSVLAGNGNEVLECESGDEAVALLGNDHEKFDLLCSDAVFPGEQLGKVLDAFERHSPHGKVLVCSGYVQEELAIRKVESGEYAFLAKPFTGNQLIAKIREIVN